jgi:hypothetical protein
MFNMFQSSEENLRRKISANQEGKKKYCAFRKAKDPSTSFNHMPNLLTLTWRHLARDTVEKGLRLVIARQRLQRITLTAWTA